MEKVIVVVMIVMLAMVVVGCTNQVRQVKPVTTWKNKDSEVSKEEFNSLTKNNNALEFKDGKILIHDKSAVVKSETETVTTYFVQNAYIPITNAKAIVKKDNWTKQEFLTKYAGAAQNIEINTKEDTIEAFFITGARGYGELRVTFKGDKVQSMTNTF